MTGGACARPPQNSAPWVRAARVSWTTSTLFWWLELEHPPTPFFCRGSIFQSTFSGNPCTMPYGLVWIRPTTKHFFRGSVAPWVGRGGVMHLPPSPRAKTVSIFKGNSPASAGTQTMLCHWQAPHSTSPPPRVRGGSNEAFPGSRWKSCCCLPPTPVKE